MYYVVLFLLCIMLSVLLLIIKKKDILLKKQQKINEEILSDNAILIDIDKFQIDYWKKGYTTKKYKGKILLGDYDKFGVSNTINVLNKIGYDIDLVCSGEDLLYKIKNNKYDYIITNYMYKSGMNGTQLCNVIKNELKINTPIIILSGSTELREEFMDNADIYISKPLTINKFKKIANSYK